MRIRFLRRTILALSTLLVVGLFIVDSTSAQQQPRNKRSRRITNPVRKSTPAPQPTPPSPMTTTTTTTPNSDARIISTADGPQEDNAAENDEPSPVVTRRTNRSRTAPAVEAEPDNTRRTVNRLSRQVEKLTDKLNQIEGQQRTLVDLERLSRAEQRAEGFRAQLRDVQTKEADLQARQDQLEFDLRPENIERSAAFYGTTRPEEARDARRRQLENEKARIKSQLDLFYTSRTRLESAIASADTEVERLRARLDTEDPATNPQTTDNNAEQTTPSDTTIPATTTTTTPTTPPPNPSPYGTP
jgi:phage shock protein A